MYLDLSQCESSDECIVITYSIHPCKLHFNVSNIVHQKLRNFNLVPRFFHLPATKGARDQQGKEDS